MAPSFGSFWSRIKDDKRPNLHSFTAPPRDTTARLLVSLYTGLFLWSSDDAKMMMMMIDHLSFHPLMMMARWQYSRNLPSPSICKRCRAKCSGSGTTVKWSILLGENLGKLLQGKDFTLDESGEGGFCFRRQICIDCGQPLVHKRYTASQPLMRYIIS